MAKSEENKIGPEKQGLFSFKSTPKSSPEAISLPKSGAYLGTLFGNFITLRLYKAYNTVQAKRKKGTTFGCSLGIRKF